jgi:GNAT superfamily N-acetyltransferase
MSLLAHTGKAHDVGLVQRLSLEDLRACAPLPSRPQRWATLLEVAGSRFAAGELLFGIVSNEHLVSYGWLQPDRSEVGSDFGVRVGLDHRSVILWDDYTDPEARGNGYHRAIIDARAAWAAHRHPRRPVVTGVLDSNAPSLHNYLRSEFSPFARLHVRTRLGRRQIALAQLEADLGVYLVSGVTEPDAAARSRKT